MPPSANNRDDHELARTLAKLFDTVGPSTRADAEEELRTAGIDPDEVGQRIRHLADSMLANGRSAAGSPAAPSRTLTPTRLAWSLAAALTLCLVGWALTHEAREPGGLLQQYRERLQRRGRAPENSRALGRLPRAENGSSARQTSEVEKPAPTAAPPSRPRAESDIGVPAPPADIAVDSIDAPRPRGGVFVPAGQIPAGEVVTARNLATHSASLTPGLQWAVRNGLQIRMSEPRTVYLPPAYREATEQYSGTVRLGPDGVSLAGYVAGQPFPAIDVNDHHAAIKIMWNHEYRPFATDDLEARDFELETGPLGENGAGMAIERRIVFGAFRRLYYNGRLFTDPRPRLPNPDGIRFRESLHPVREPADLRGIGQSMTRYTDVGKADESWMYLPGLQRVRRLSPVQRSDAAFGQDADADSYFGFSGPVAGMTWRLIGEAEAPGCLHAENRPVQWGQRSADFVFDDVWEMRPVYIVEGTSKLARYAYSRRVLYIDREAWVVLMSDIYDRSGELWKVWLNMFSADDAGGQIDNPAAVMIDVQLRHATRVAVPSLRFADSPGWVFNQGEQITEDWFKIAHLIEGGN